MQHRFLGGNHSIFNGKLTNSKTLENMGLYFTDQRDGPGSVDISNLLFETVSFMSGLKSIGRHQKKFNKLPDAEKMDEIFNKIGKNLQDFCHNHNEKEAVDALQFCIASINDDDGLKVMSESLKQYYDNHENLLKTFLSSEESKPHFGNGG